MKTIITTTIIFFLLLNSFAQEKVETSPVIWYTIEQAMELNKKTPKPIMIDVYTDWCGWCKKMMKTTFTNTGIANYINTYYYPVRLDAETKDTITYKGKKYVSKGKTHELAIELLDKKMSYPTMIFIDKAGQKFVIPGYLSTNDIQPILIYFAEELNKVVNYQEFNTAYLYSYPKVYQKELKELPNEQRIDTTGTVKWLSFEEAIEQNKTKKKKFFVFTHVEWCNSCKVMNKTTYRQPEIAKILNNNFYSINFNAASQDTIKIEDKTFVSLGKGQPHQFAMTLMNKQLIFPSVIILNEKFEVLNMINGFMLAKRTELILNYFSTDSFKTQKFEIFMNNFESKIK